MAPHINNELVLTLVGAVINKALKQSEISLSSNAIPSKVSVPLSLFFDQVQSLLLKYTQKFEISSEPFDNSMVLSIIQRSNFAEFVVINDSSLVILLTNFQSERFKNVILNCLLSYSKLLIKQIYDLGNEGMKKDNKSFQANTAVVNRKGETTDSENSEKALEQTSARTAPPVLEPEVFPNSITKINQSEGSIENTETGGSREDAEEKAASSSVIADSQEKEDLRDDKMDEDEVEVNDTASQQVEQLAHGKSPKQTGQTEVETKTLIGQTTEVETIKDTTNAAIESTELPSSSGPVNTDTSNGLRNIDTSKELKPENGDTEENNETNGENEGDNKEEKIIEEEKDDEALVSDSLASQEPQESNETSPEVQNDEIPLEERTTTTGSEQADEAKEDMIAESKESSIEKEGGDLKQDSLTGQELDPQPLEDNTMAPEDTANSNLSIINSPSSPSEASEQEDIKPVTKNSSSVDELKIVSTNARKRSTSPATSSTNKRFQNIAVNLIKSIQAHRYSSPFLQAVQKRDAADYYDVVYEPKDLKTILKAIKSKADPEYSSVKQLERDIMLMFANCIMYNKSDEDLVQLTISMRNDVMKLFKIFEEAESEMQ